MFQAQKPWEKKYRAVAKSKSEYHSACKNEKSTALQENNARNDDAVSPDQVIATDILDATLWVPLSTT